MVGINNRSNRRAFLKKCSAGLAGILVARKAPATIVKSMLGSRNIMATSTSARLPSEYQECQFLDSQGSAWIDTKVAAKAPVRADLKFLLNRTGADKSIIGTGGGSNRMYFGCHDYRFFFGYSSYVYGSQVTLNKVYNAVVNWVAGDAYAAVDGIHVADISSTYNVNYTSYAIGLFTRNLGASTVSYVQNCKIYYCNIYSGETLVRQFVPCWRKEDSKAGMYDLVNEVFYTNRGTGADFICGGAVV